MHVHRKIDAGLVHMVEDPEHFRALFRGWLMPFAVEIGAHRIGPQMAASRAVRVHVRNDMKCRFFAQHAGHRIGRVGQAVKRAFHPPFGHRFARMLARIEPDGKIAGTDAEIVEFPAIKGLPERRMADAVAPGDFGDQVIMALNRIGREIGEPQRVGLRAMADCQRAVAIVGLGEEPVLAITRHAGLVIVPALRIGTVARIGDGKREILPGTACDAEIEPLIEIGLVILDDLQFR